MKVLVQLPQWFTLAALSALLVAVGYMGRILLQWCMEVTAGLRKRRVRLVTLLTLLRAHRTAGSAPETSGETRERINELLWQWLEQDEYFKSRTWGMDARSQLARKLAELQTFCILWRSKHVFVAGRNEPLFPDGIDDLAQELLARRFWF